MRLNQHLQDLGPEAVAVSCSVLGALPTTRRFIEASTAAGVPIVVGGPAFGADDVRARALGATAWAPSAQGVVAAVNGLPAVVPPAPTLPAGPAGEQVLHAVAAALLTSDHRLVSESAWWIADLMRTRGIDVAAVYELGDVLTESLSDYPLARELITRHFAAGIDWT